MTSINCFIKNNHIKKIIALCTAITLLSGCNSSNLGVKNKSNNAEKIVMNSTEAKELYTPKELKEDFDFMIKTMEEVHPNLYYAIDKDTFEKESIDIRNSIKKPMSAIDFYKITAPLIAKLKDGHTSLKPPFIILDKYLQEGEKIFPYEISIKDNRLWAIKDTANENIIPIGSEILSINNVMSSEIITESIKCLSGEKNNFRIKVLENYLSLIYWTLYGKSDTYTIEYSFNNDKQIVTVDGATYNRIDAYVEYKGKSQDSIVNYTFYTIPEISAGVIDFRSFTNFAAFENFLENTFVEINKNNLSNLIIDIRENGGGNSALGDLLTCYITDNNFATYSRVDEKGSSQIIDRYKAKGQSVQVSADGSSAVISNGSYSKKITVGTIYTSDCEEEIPYPVKNKFTGNVYLLTSSYTFSSATDFASIFKDYKLGTIIGEETGGLATSYGDVYSFKLPNTNLDAGVSYKYFVRPSGSEDMSSGVIPDYEVSQTIDDIKTDIDTVMEYTKKLIKTNNPATKK